MARRRDARIERLRSMQGYWSRKVRDKGILTEQDLVGLGKTQLLLGMARKGVRLLALPFRLC